MAVVEAPLNHEAAELSYEFRMFRDEVLVVEKCDVIDVTQLKR